MAITNRIKPSVLTRRNFLKTLGAGSVVAVLPLPSANAGEGFLRAGLPKKIRLTLEKFCLLTWA